jgi:hypothetical protein
MYSTARKARDTEANAAIDQQVVDMRKLLNFMREADASGALNALRRTFPAIVQGTTVPQVPDRRRS